MQVGAPVLRPPYGAELAGQTLVWSGRRNQKGRMGAGGVHRGPLCPQLSEPANDSSQGGCCKGTRKLKQTPRPGAATCVAARCHSCICCCANIRLMLLMWALIIFTSLKWSSAFCQDPTQAFFCLSIFFFTFFFFWSINESEQKECSKS